MLTLDVLFHTKKQGQLLPPCTWQTKTLDTYIRVKQKQSLTPNAPGKNKTHEKTKNVMQAKKAGTAAVQQFANQKHNRGHKRFRICMYQVYDNKKTSSSTTVQHRRPRRTTEKNQTTHSSAHKTKRYTHDMIPTKKNKQLLTAVNTTGKSKTNNENKRYTHQLKDKQLQQFANKCY